MLNQMQVDRMLKKLKRLEKTMEPYIFSRIGEVDVTCFETSSQYHQIPNEDQRYKKINKGDRWGSEGAYCWFKGTALIPLLQKGKDIFIEPDVGGYEGMLWVNGKPSGIFSNKIINTKHGNHYCNLLIQRDYPESDVSIAIEFYAGHYIIGTQPMDTSAKGSFKYTYGGIYLCIKNQDIADFIFDLKTLNQMAEKMDPLSFRRADILNCLTEVHKTVYYAVEDTDESIWRKSLERAREIMRPYLEDKNSDSAAIAGIVGHSHMDTAWLWPISETIKKCARTFSNQISLMKQYPEYRFIQSSAYHFEMIRLHYPELFKMIGEAVKSGRYEPNGGVYVEADCNMTSGESMIRQFLWGQRYTRKHFNYISNCFWLPDTFGYSAAIPQIMKGCGVDYFLTTKLSWNDTNRFPYETFYWEGIDGTSVLTHFNTIHCWPDPKTLLEQIEGRDNAHALQNKTVAKKRLIAYGYGDGGGGPQFEMVEMARRIIDLEGCPKAEHVNVGQFMMDLEKEVIDPPRYKGELYLELHRGTLTSQHQIKRNNRKAEINIHDLEFLNVFNAVDDGIIADDSHIRPLLETVLVNQFHDILPGTSIEVVNDQSHKEMTQVMEETEKMIVDAIKTQPEDNTFTIMNTLGFKRNEIIYIKNALGNVPADNEILSQKIENIHGDEQLCIGGVTLPPLGSTIIRMEPGDKEKTSKEAKITYIKDSATGMNILTTPYAKVLFNEDGTIESFIDIRANRELRGSGVPLNTFLIAEDVPAAWDNWDIDADCQMKFKPTARLIDRKLIGCGEIQCRIRSIYQISEKSRITQDMIFYSENPRVDFETIIDWQEKHRFLKVGFNTTVKSNSARHEIQFGHSQKPTTRNTSIEQAMFEVVNHKFTDLSETRFGVALLNDCKYGVSVEGSDIRLSLHKGGCRPDPRGDKGIHECVYSFLPHVGSFSAENVIMPAYALNSKPIVKKGQAGYITFAEVDSSNVLIETVKACEENQKAYIIRLYEAEGTYTHIQLTLGMNFKRLWLTNMLEEELSELPCSRVIKLAFNPFEIKTIKVAY